MQTDGPIELRFQCRFPPGDCENIKYYLHQLLGKAGVSRVEHDAEIPGMATNIIKEIGKSTEQFLVISSQRMLMGWRGNLRQNTRDVDPMPINESACDLPFSRQRRPEWGEAVLNRMGLENTRVKRFDKPWRDPETGEIKSLTITFYLSEIK